MKKIIFLFLALTGNAAYAQNVGIGTTNPGNKLHVIGNLLINQPTVSTIVAPTPAQTKNVINSSTIIFPATDSTGLIYDPGGPAGNYTANVTAYAQINGVNGCVGIELNFLDMDLNIGDSLIILEGTSSINPPLLAVGNNYTLTGKITINGAGFYLIFKSNADINLGRGFNLQFRRLYTNAAISPTLVNYAGNALYYDVRKTAFRAGFLNNSKVGDYSFGAGYYPGAIGNYSVAFGNRTIASGDY
ncbi:MAG TPA: hypothetical protein VK498_14485, partial [Ferruginibacter sp.]|nr:hypothetical protein [Ferruginibacter sp.]